MMKLLDAIKLHYDIVVNKFDNIEDVNRNNVVQKSKRK